MSEDYLEQCVVTPDLQLTGGLDVVVNLPEVLDSVDSGHVVLVLVPRSAFIVAEVPEGPAVVEGVLHLGDDSRDPERDVIFNGPQLSPRSKVTLPEREQFRREVDLSKTYLVPGLLTLL